MRGVFRVLVWLGIIFMMWISGLLWFANTIHSFNHEKNKIVTQQKQAIVVLTGGSGRVEAGLKLLAQGKGAKLFISGVDKSVPMADIMAQAPAMVRAAIQFFSAEKITLGREATNTIANAEESAAWIASHHFTHVVLVTSDYHMPRSLLEFHALMPDVHFQPFAIETAHYNRLQWLRDDKLRALVLSEYHKYIAAYLRHLLLLGGAAA